MNLDEIKKKVKEIIISSLELDLTPEEIDGNDLVNEIGINSIDALQIFVFIESNFEFQIPDEDLNSDLLTSLDNLTEYIFKQIV